MVNKRLQLGCTGSSAGAWQLHCSIHVRVEMRIGERINSVALISLGAKKNLNI